MHLHMHLHMHQHTHIHMHCVCTLIQYTGSHVLQQSVLSFGWASQVALPNVSTGRAAYLALPLKHRVTRCHPLQQKVAQYPPQPHPSIGYKSWPHQWGPARSITFPRSGLSDH